MSLHNFINNDINNKINIEFETLDEIEMSTHNYDHLFKILLIGDTNVGKSSLILDIINLKDNILIEKIQNTLGVDFHFKELIINNREIKIQICDTAGQERFRSITSSYYKIAHGVLLVFDLNSEKSFNNVETWINELKNFVNIENMPIILIGNKCDLERKINNYKLNDIINKYKLPYFETKYKDNSINNPFEYLTKCIFNKLLQDETEGNDILWSHNNLTLKKYNKENKKDCCFIN